MTNIRGILNDLQNYNRKVGLDTTPDTINIFAKPLLPHTPKNQPRVSFPLPVTENQQEESINSLENQGISSSLYSTKNQGISNNYLQFQNYNLTMVFPPLKHHSPTNHGHIFIPIIMTNHSQRAGSHLTKNQGI